MLIFKCVGVQIRHDYVTNLEIALNTLAEASAAELSKQRDPKGFQQQTQVAKDGGSVAKVARNQLESQLGRSIISSSKASDYIKSIEPSDDENPKLTDGE